MIAIEEVAEGTYRLETPLPGVGSVFSVYLIDGEKGVLIEPGPAAAIPSIQEGMKQLGIEELSYVIPTHIHVDHAGGLGKLAELFPQAKVLLHPRGVKHIVDPSRLVQSTKVSFGDDFEVRYGHILPVSESQVKVPVDGEMISIGDRELQIIYAPGHAHHHIAIFDRKTEGLFCGEALGVPRILSDGEIFLMPPAIQPSFDMELCLGTMERLRRLKPRLLCYSHDGSGRNPEKLIFQAAENARVCGDMILKSLNEGESPAATVCKIREYVYAHFGFEMEEADTGDMVDGYVLYFKKKGLA